jgi:hypothetical protein
MLYLTLVLSILILMCAALTVNRAWTQANVWIVPLGALCVVIGVLMEALRFQHAKGVTENKKRPYTLPARDQSPTMPSGCLSMLLAAGFVALGLALLMLQAMAFFWN